MYGPACMPLDSLTHLVPAVCISNGKKWHCQTWQAFVCIETQAGILNHDSTINLQARRVSGRECAHTNTQMTLQLQLRCRNQHTCCAAILHFSLAISSGSPCKLPVMSKRLYSVDHSRYCAAEGSHLQLWQIHVCAAHLKGKRVTCFKYGNNLHS